MFCSRTQTKSFGETEEEKQNNAKTRETPPRSHQQQHSPNSRLGQRASQQGGVASGGMHQRHSVLAATKGPFTSWRDGSYSALQVCAEDSRRTQQFLVLRLHVAARSSAYTMLTWTIHQTFRKPSYLWATAHSCFSLKKKIGSVLHWVTRRWLSGQQNRFH